MRLYEGVSKEVTQKINDKLDQLEARRNMTTDRERQYMFFKFLQTLPLTEKQTFDVYTNTAV